MAVSSDPINFLQHEVAHTRRLLLNNGLYYRLQTLADLRRFMEHHVFAVWDFMSLLKTLQRELTCLHVPWVPTPNAGMRRLINEVVLETESDVDAQGQPASHFELYVRAMEECGADTGPIRRLVAAVSDGRSLSQALDAAQAPDSVRQHIENTFGLIRAGRMHALAAAFAFGREDLIPTAFREVVNGLRHQFPGSLDTFTYYLDRCVRPEKAAYASLAQQMVRELCADNPELWLECQQVAVQCLEARMALWDGIMPNIIRRLPA